MTNNAAQTSVLLAFNPRLPPQKQYDAIGSFEGEEKTALCRIGYPVIESFRLRPVFAKSQRTLTEGMVKLLVPDRLDAALDAAPAAKRLEQHL